MRRSEWFITAVILTSGIVLLGWSLYQSEVRPWQAQRAAEAVAALPVLSANGLREVPIGERVLVEGPIASNPPLTLETPDGPVRIANNDYAYFFLPSHSRRDEAGNHISGFATGESVLVDGRVIEGGDMPTLEATFLHSGPQAEYVDFVSGSAYTQQLNTDIFRILACVSLPVVLIGLWLLRSLVRERQAAK